MEEKKKEFVDFECSCVSEETLEKLVHQLHNSSNYTHTHVDVPYVTLAQVGRVAGQSKHT